MGPLFPHDSKQLTVYIQLSEKIRRSAGEFGELIR